MKKLLILIMLLPTLVFGRKFYFSATTGNDSYTVAQAQSSATPWKSLVNLHKFANGSYPFGTAPNRAAAGDTFLFKCGDVFSTGFGNTNDDFGVVKWWNGVAGYTAPTGTANAPIVFTSYGTGDRPNFLFPNPTAVIGKNRNVLTFKNVGYVYFINLQFNDTRFPVNDKVSTAYTAAGLFIGESNASICNNIIVTNCNFSNTAYGIRSCARVMEISNNTFTNFKSPGDTLGINDIGADALLPSGYRYLIKNNLIQGSWAYANPNSSSQGKLGGGLETINDFDSSLIIYNTFLDNSGAMEFGQNAGIQYGPTEDTFAYNKFINNSVVSYVNVTGTFACTAKNIHFWNNLIVENGNSRHSGANFGQDVLGDGQSFTTWSFWPSYPLNPSVSNPTGWRPFQYASDAGVTADTLYDIRNNIIWNNNGLIMKYTGRTKIKYRNNIYKLGGGSTLGAALDAGEINTATKIITDTSAANPANWDARLLANSVAINAGMYVGVTLDYGGNVVSNPPDIGIYEYQTPTSTLQATSTFTTVACNGGSSTVTVAATGGTPPYQNIGQFVRGAGAYAYTVTDNANATSITTGTIPQPTALIAAATTGVIGCNGGTTTITVTATGGTSPYSGTGTFTASAGPYSYTVTDANSCTNTITGTLTQPTLLNAAVAIGTIAVYGGTTTVTVTAVGGTPPYQYKIDGGNYQSSSSITGVPAGGHVITTKDANNCTTDNIITVSQPGPANLKSRLKFINVQ